MSDRKKIAIIGVVGLPSKYGGFETLVEHLAKHLGGIFDLTVFCSSKSYEERLPKFNNVHLVYVSLKANGFQSIFYDIVSIFKALRFANTILILGVSGCLILPLIRIISKTKIVVNIDGQEWMRSKWNWLAKYFLKISEKIAVNFSDQIISDSKILQEYVLEEYGKESTLIEYGGDHVVKVPLSTEMKNTHPLSQKAYAFTVCRIEPENNIHVILEAFSQLSFPIILVGNFKNSKYGIELIKRFSMIENIQICDPIYDQDKLDQLRGNAALYIHGHSAGGTNPSLVEAMFLGLPVIAFDVNYNRQTTENCAEYFDNAKKLKNIVERYSVGAITIDGKKMQRIALERYTWQTIALKYEKILS